MRTNHVLVDYENVQPTTLKALVGDHPFKALLFVGAIQAGFEIAGRRFLTAFEGLSDSVFKKTVSDLASDTAAWFVSEPKNIVFFESSEP